MSEATWTNRLESKATEDAGYNHEIKADYPILDKTQCDYHGCFADAVRCYELGRINQKWFEEVNLCQEHNDTDTAWEIYDEL